MWPYQYNCYWDVDFVIIFARGIIIYTFSCLYNVHIGPLYNTHVCVPCIHLILSVFQPLCKQSLCMWFLTHFHKFRFGYRFIQKKNEWICLPLLHFISGWLSFSTFFSFTQLCRFIWNPFFSHFASFFFHLHFHSFDRFPFFHHIYF